jgi:hypothetical protein
MTRNDQQTKNLLVSYNPKKLDFFRPTPAGHGRMVITERPLRVTAARGAQPGAGRSA